MRRKRQEEVTKKLLIKEKLFPVQNPDVLENNCSKIQAPSQDNRADSQSSHLQHFEYSSFSRPISKVKLLRGTPSRIYSIHSDRSPILFTYSRRKKKEKSTVLYS